MVPMDITALQTNQLSKDNDVTGLLDITGLTDFLAEMSTVEGDLIPFVVRTGPMSRPDPGLLIITAIFAVWAARFFK